MKTYNKNRHNAIRIFFIFSHIFSITVRKTGSTSTQSQAQTGILNSLHRPESGWKQPWIVFRGSGT